MHMVRKMPFLVRLSIALFCIAPIITIVTWATVNDDASDTVDWLEVNESIDILAIKELHARLDDDKDGKVDSLESEEFAREELHVSEQDGRRSRTFHKEDDYITYDELLKKWKNSKVYNWSVDEVEKWLKSVVNLPEQVPQFRRLHITGRFLPWIATNRDEIMQKLDVKGAQKSKLVLRATDAVLFGPPEIHHSYWKDGIVVLSITFCVVAITMAWRQHSSANTKLDSFLEEIKYYEKELSKLRSKIRQAEANSKSAKEEIDSECSVDKTSSDVTITDEKEENEVEEPKQSLSSDEDMLQENETLKLKIWSLETQLDNARASQLSLRELLVQSSQQEWYYLDAIKKTAEDDVVRAQKVCDKIRRRRGSMLGAFRLANSSTLEDAGLLITKAVNKMQDITEDFEEYHSRWKKIEQICSFPIITGSHGVPLSLPQTMPIDSTIVFTQSGNGSAISHTHIENGSVAYSGAAIPTPLRSTSLPGDIPKRRRYHSQGDVLSNIPSHLSAPSNLNQKLDYTELNDHNLPKHSTELYLKKHRMSSTSSLGVIQEIKQYHSKEDSKSLDLAVTMKKSPKASNNSTKI